MFFTNPAALLPRGYYVQLFVLCFLVFIDIRHYVLLSYLGR